MRAWRFESLLSVTHQCGAAYGAAREARMCGACAAGAHRLLLCCPSGHVSEEQSRAVAPELFDSAA